MTTADIARGIMADKGFPIDEGVLSAAVTDMVLAVLRRLCKREWGTRGRWGTSTACAHLSIFLDEAVVACSFQRAAHSSRLFH
jgi:hypothetical protein